MATLADLHSISTRLPGAVVSPDGFAISVLNKGKEKGFAWAWAERVHPKKAKVRNPDVLAVSVMNLDVKEMLLASDTEKFFTEPHYNGFPAILVRLDTIGVDELENLLIEAWRCKAPVDLVREFDLT